MATNINLEQTLCDYFEEWIKIYKEGAVRTITLRKYHMALSWLREIVPDLKVSELNRTKYQEIINAYAAHHERQTTMDFHHQIKASILDAVDDGYIEREPTRKVIIKGKPAAPKKPKYLNQYELHKLLGALELGNSASWDYLILLVAKTGLRFSEALALTPADFDFRRQFVSINKTWDYKGDGGYLPTKNKSSVRKVQLDWQTLMQFAAITKDMPQDDPIFASKDKAVYNSTANAILERRCKTAGVPVIAIHGLRHTHASLLLFAGVSIASVARRLGHASMTTTQRTYLHVIQELENKDTDLVMRAMSGLC